MLPAPLKKLAICDAAPVSADRMYFRFHLRSYDSQRPSTIALWARARGDKKPFPSVKLTHYAHAICLLGDGRLLAFNDRGPSTVFDGLTTAPFETPQIEDVTWHAGQVIDGSLVLVGAWGAVQRRDPQGAWHDLSAGALTEHVHALAAHPSGGFVVAGKAGLAHIKAGATTLPHALGSAPMFDVHCRADGTIVAAGDGGVIHGPLDALAAIPHPSRGDFRSVAAVGNDVFVAGDDALYVLTNGQLERIACPVAPPMLQVRAVGDTLVAFNENAAHARTGGTWEQLA